MPAKVSRAAIKWAARLVLFLRVMAGIALIKGLYYWAIVCGVGAPTPQGFDFMPCPISRRRCSSR